MMSTEHRNVHSRHKRVIFESSTAALEWWTGLGMMVAGFWLAFFDVIPWSVRGQMVPDWMTSRAWGGTLFVMGFLQWWFADTTWNAARAIMAAVVAFLLSYVALSFLTAGQFWRWICAFLMVLSMAEAWMAFRLWAERAPWRNAVWFPPGPT